MQEKVEDLLEENEEHIVENYNNKADQILIDKSLVEKLNAFVSSSFSKDDLEECIKYYLELKESDLIFYKKGYMFIKITDDSKRHVVQEADKGTKAERYNGIDENELEEFNKEFFADKENQNFFVEVAQEFVDTYIFEKKINNAEYEKFVFAYINKIVFSKLVKLYDNEDGFFTGFSGYLFRNNFHLVFEYIADIFLKEISLSNHNVIEFLKYYSSGVVVIGGVKYEVPTIQSEEGIPLNIVSITPVAKVYSKTVHAIKKLKNDINIVAPKIKKLYIGNASPVEFSRKLVKSIQGVEVKIVTYTKKLKVHYDNLDKITNDKLKLQREKEKSALLQEIKDLNKELENLNAKTLHPSVTKEYSKLQGELDTHSRHLKTQENILSQNKQNYLAIRTSLIKALISKKKKL